MGTQRWTVGDATITSVVEDEIHHIPPELFFTAATAAEIAAYPDLVPDYTDSRGNIAMRVQALVVETGSRCVLVDPCVGNGKTRTMPFWHDQNYPFLERFAEAGLTTDGIDTVVHTHLHADHVGWATQFVDGAWTPTFTAARHLYIEREVEWCRSGDNPGTAGVYADSVEPIFDAGLADLVDDDADLGDGLRLEGCAGHTPGQVSLWIESAGELALITGDFIHHPVQCHRPEWAEVGDLDDEVARVARRRMLGRAAATEALVIGTHFSVQPGGHVVTDGDAWRFVPVN